jgi:MtN3 and saliva related transmembrane protein
MMSPIPSNFSTTGKKHPFLHQWRKICRGKRMNWTQIIGLAAGILTASSLIPQVIKTFKAKSAEDVSILMLLVLQAGIILWIVYGIKREDMPIILTNSFSLLVNITMVVLGIKYKKAPGKGGVQ